jgi:hypothetical protein
MSNDLILWIHLCVHNAVLCLVPCCVAVCCPSDSRVEGPHGYPWLLRRTPTRTAKTPDVRADEQAGEGSR